MTTSFRNIIRDQLSDAPELLGWFDDHLGTCGEAVLRQLVEEADESAFSIRQWVAALALLDAWLSARRLAASSADQIGYIGCACAAAGASPAYQALSPLLEDFLTDYGFERATPVGH